jgi:hypothetical protein
MLLPFRLEKFGFRWWKNGVDVFCFWVQQAESLLTAQA